MKSPNLEGGMVGCSMKLTVLAAVIHGACVRLLAGQFGFAKGQVRFVGRRGSETRTFINPSAAVKTWSRARDSAHEIRRATLIWPRPMTLIAKATESLLTEFVDMPSTKVSSDQ